VTNLGSTGRTPADEQASQPTEAAPAARRLGAGVGTVVVLGDSMSVGFGAGGRSYGAVVSEALGAEKFVNLAALGRTTRQMMEEDTVTVAALRPDVVLAYAGMADSLPHPGERIQRIIERFAPPSWHGVDGLHRRAYFSGSRLRRAQQWVEATAKTTLKRTFIHLTGGYTRMNPEDFGVCLDGMLTELERHAAVVSVGMFNADERRFPLQQRLNQPFRAQRFAVLADHPRVVPAEIIQRLRCWDDFMSDHAHWNAEGHAAVADEILAALRAACPDLVRASGPVAATV
jgi:lysophospholipase L1-like esterase